MIYFDHAATTPLMPEAFEAMGPFLGAQRANPSSPHTSGRAARTALERAREKLADTLRADPKEILFTSGGTEGINMALKGAAWARRDKGTHLVVSQIEHAAVLEAADYLAHHGFQVTRVAPDSEGVVHAKAVEAALRPETVLVAVMAANNETGALQPVREIGELARSRGVLFLTDAVQAYGKVPLSDAGLFTDMLAVSGHKIHGPQGVGFLYVRRGVDLVPLVHGGGQERGRRSGTENVAGAVGLAEAAERCVAAMDRNRESLDGLCTLLWQGLKGRLPDLEVNGPLDPSRRVPGLLNLRLPDLEGETLVHSLDAKGFAVSTGAACATGSSGPSHVLLAMGRDKARAQQSLRISLGPGNTEGEVREMLEVLPLAAERLTAMSSLWMDTGKKA